MTKFQGPPGRPSPLLVLMEKTQQAGGHPGTSEASALLCTFSSPSPDFMLHLPSESEPRCTGGPQTHMVHTEQNQAGFQPHLASVASCLDEAHRPNDFIHRPWSTSGLRKSSLGFHLSPQCTHGLAHIKGTFVPIEKNTVADDLIACPSLITCHSLVSNCQHLQFSVSEHFLVWRPLFLSV